MGFPCPWQIQKRGKEGRLEEGIGRKHLGLMTEEKEIRFPPPTKFQSGLNVPLLGFADSRP
jgi:hypothetical protein